MKTLSGNIVDVLHGEVYTGTIGIEGSKIVRIVRESGPSDRFILPPLVDAHVHIESSMLVPSEFARLAVRHGTVASVSDPHEIANVMGMRGVDFMLDNGDTVPLKFFFGAPSCVPATAFETAGHTLDSGKVANLLQRVEIKYLSEMMNFPGVIEKDPEVMRKLEAARRCREAGFDLVVVLGHPSYYPKTGFVPSARFGIRCKWEVPEEVFMVQALKEDVISNYGRVVHYHPAFDMVT